MSIEHLVLKLAEEVLDRSVIQSVAFSRHGLDDSPVVQSFVPDMLLILPALIGMEYETCQIFEFTESYVQQPSLL